MKKLFLAMVMAVISAIAVSAQENGKENTMEVLPVQTDKNDGYEGDATMRCGIKFNIRIPTATIAAARNPTS